MNLDGKKAILNGMKNVFYFFRLGFGRHRESNESTNVRLRLQLY